MVLPFTGGMSLSMVTPLWPLKAIVLAAPGMPLFRPPMMFCDASL